MTELSEGMVQRRYETVTSGTYKPEIPGLPDLVFTKMSLGERGKSSRAYSAKLKELMAEGGYFAEALLPTVLERTCRDNGLSLDVVKQKQQFYRRFIESIPPELSGPFDQLTDEEVAELSSEQRAERQQAIEERGRQIMKWQQEFFSEEDLRVFEQAQQIENLEQQLRANTAEHFARKHQMETEILLCARQAVDTNKPYFESIEDIQELADTNHQGLVQLYLKWKQFKEGLLPQFFRPDRAH